LPIGAALLLYRFLEVALLLLRGQSKSLIVSHEADEAVEQIAAENKEA
ncbi:MAG: TRAP transporter small permease, partial [Marinovum sp.]|nr:TRAP transporter small permease [Marinovum sp.]